MILMLQRRNKTTSNKSKTNNKNKLAKKQIETYNNKNQN